MIESLEKQGYQLIGYILPYEDGVGECQVLSLSLHSD